MGMFMIFCSLSQTERRCRVVNTPVSYSADPGSNLGLVTGYPEFCRVFLSIYRKMPGWYFKLGHDHFAHYFQFIIHLIPINELSPLLF
jgi:hypothetical protein